MLKSLTSISFAAGLALYAGWFTPVYAQSKIIAKVGDLEISEQELTVATSDLAQQFQSVPEANRRGAVLSALIDIKLLANKAKSENFDERELYKSQMSFVSSRALHNLYFQENVVKTISDEEVKARYEKEIGVTEPKKQIKARHILVKTEEEAKAIIADLEAGKDFIELAKEKSTGPSGPGGGDLGFFGRGQMVPEFETAAFGLEDGQFTKAPVKTQFGFHVILREEEREEPLPTFEEAEDQIRQLVLREKYFEMIKSSRESLPIEIFDADLKAAVDAAAR